MKQFFIICLLTIPTILGAQEKKAFGMQLEIGYGKKLSNKALDYNSVHFFATPTISLGSNFRLGAGLGLTNLHRKATMYTQSDKLTIIPAYGYAKFIFLTTEKLHPFVAGKLGYGFSQKKYTAPYKDNSTLNVTQQGGLFLSPEAGLMYQLNNGHNISLSLSYDLQRIKTKTGITNSNTTDISNDYATLAFKIGYIF